MQLSKIILAAAALAGVVYFATRSSPAPRFLLAPTLTDFPVNVRKCSDKASYSLNYSDFKTTDVVKGTPAQMNSTFTSATDGHIEKLYIKVYKGPIKIYTMGIDQGADYKANTPFVFSFNTTIPTVVPPFQYTLNLSFVNKKNEELSCIGFEITFH